MPPSLNDFLSALSARGELHQIDTDVDPLLEIAAITRKVSSYPAGGPALLFNNPAGYNFRIATNLLGSPKRNCIALGIGQLGELEERFKAIVKASNCGEYADLARFLVNVAGLNSYSPYQAVSENRYHDLNGGPDLLKLPWLQNWPEDGTAAGTGRYITLGQVITTALDGTAPNCGIYRCQIHDSRTLAIRWRPGSGAAQHFSQYQVENRPMPLAIVLGGPPALTLASAWPLPIGLDELKFAGWLQRTAIPVTCCKHAPLEIPAEAELIIEGFALPGKTLLEGPFGNHTGLYDQANIATKVVVERIYHKPQPIIPATIVGPPPQEDCWMMKGWERILAALLRQLIPDLVDISLPIPWVFRGSAVVALANPTPAKVRDTVEALWQLPWFKSSRLLVVVNGDISTTDLMQAAWQLVNLPDWQNRLIKDQTGTRLAVDATRQITKTVLKDSLTEALIEKRWKEYGLP